MRQGPLFYSVSCEFWACVRAVFKSKGLLFSIFLENHEGFECRTGDFYCVYHFVVVVVVESSFILMGSSCREEALTANALLPGSWKIENAGVSRRAASAAFLAVSGAGPIAGMHFWNFTSLAGGPAAGLG